ncbi:glycosyltransferase [Nocardia jejuensis]|uniref:glycosyltransferase n=1 Tax=Nocardia jejuensis TaxID=328049 RepID=UPI000833DF13|nr:glycosyltransferase family 2 protein [Nocardia jejuensis]
MTSQPALTVVVPVLNESASIEPTLRQLVAQAKIEEVIVVDNGSDDDTAHVVQEFAIRHPKVVLLHEPVRGITFARNAGFDKARGDIIARTDADTVVSDEWGATILGFLAENPDTAAVTGLCTYHDSPVGFLLRWGQRLMIRTRQLGGPVGNMYGPNMALRRTAWLQVREHTQHRADVAEDLDLALCLLERHLRIEQLTTMRAQTSARRRRTSPTRQWQFQMIGLRTLRDHGIEPRLVDRVVVTLAWLTHTIQWPIYRWWDFGRRRFSLHPGIERVSSVGR